MSKIDLKYLLFLLITSLVIIFIACSKDRFENRDIIAGSGLGINKTRYDQTLKFESNESTIDINQNGENDFAFIKELWGSPGLGLHTRLSINPLHENAELIGYNKTDTVVIIISENDYADLEGIIHVTTYSYYCSQNAHSWDSIAYTSDNLKLKYFQEGDKLSGDMYFTTDTILIRDEPVNISGTNMGQFGDTTFIINRNYFNDCYTFTPNDIIYIGIRLNKKRLGWIKVIISEDLTINLLETGIQRM